MTRTFSPEQEAYMKAKALYETAKEAMRPEEDLIDWEDEDKAVEQETELRRKYQIDAAFALLVAAEKALLQWTHDQVKNLPQYKAHQADIENLYRKAPLHPQIRRQLCELSMKLAV